ncbi:hypothetical protein F5Y06DRAFT_261238, partial [Hypoxylon sp. FL0890]
MAVDQDEPRPLILDLYEDDDTDDRFCKSLMRHLVEGSRAPSQVAQDLDTWVVNESSRRLQEFTTRPDLVEKDEDGYVPRRSMPNASGYVEIFFQSFPNLCPVFPPYHAGQTRIIQFVEALVAMPEHQAPDYFTNGNLSDVHMISLWSDGGYRTEQFRIGADGLCL